jgi:hypothetical protein
LPDFWADKGVMLFKMIVYRLCLNKKVLWSVDECSVKHVTAKKWIPDCVLLL